VARKLSVQSDQARGPSPRAWYCHLGYRRLPRCAASSTVARRHPDNAGGQPRMHRANATPRTRRCAMTRFLIHWRYCLSSPDSGVIHKLDAGGMSAADCHGDRVRRLQKAGGAPGYDLVNAGRQAESHAARASCLDQAGSDSQRHPADGSVLTAVRGHWLRRTGRPSHDGHRHRTSGSWFASGRWLARRGSLVCWPAGRGDEHDNGENRSHDYL
jgi:hypothetical protein